MRSLDRLEETLDLERSALLIRDLSSLEEFNRRKSQSLLEISRLVRSVAGDAPDLRAAKRLDRIRTKLEGNLEVIHRHMQAVQEVANIVSEAIQNADSDGTYSVRAQGVGVSA